MRSALWGPAKGSDPQKVRETKRQEACLKWNANFRNRDAMPLNSVFGGSGIPLARATGLNSAALRSSAANISNLAMISSVGSTQSIGIELQRSVGQLSRNGPLPRVPPAT